METDNSAGAGFRVLRVQLTFETSPLTAHLIERKGPGMATIQADFDSYKYWYYSGHPDEALVYCYKAGTYVGRIVFFKDGSVEPNFSAPEPSIHYPISRFDPTRTHLYNSARSTNPASISSSAAIRSSPRLPMPANHEPARIPRALCFDVLATLSSL
jgi:hypothetical protein